MDQVQHMTILWVCGVFCALGFAYDCPYEECICTGSDIVCASLELTSVPYMLTQQNPYSPNFHLENNLLTAIPKGCLPANLSSIYLLNNPIRSIDEFAFNVSATNLRTLTFSNAYFTRIPNAFIHIKALSRLYIQNCSIQDWNITVMEHIGQTVQTLDLENVGLGTWPMWIKYFLKLTDLTLADSNISAIPNDAFESSADTLTSLSLFNNKLTSVPNALVNLTGLQMVYLQGNKITDFTWLSSGSKLNSLSLSNNKISDEGELSNALRSFAETLYDLRIDMNQLRAIPNMSFLQNVRDLDFSYNQISDPNSGSMPPDLSTLTLANNNFPSLPRLLSSLAHVSELIVNDNSITGLQATNFPPSTVTVDLGHNLITELTDESFPPNSNIKSLDLNNNPIISISTAALNNLRQLKNLDLRETKLARLPVGLGSLTSLESFDISGSIHLVCTCVEKSLGTWLLHLSRENIRGDCGQISIYDFFSTLSPECPT